MSDHDPINELTDVVDLFGASPRRAVPCPVADGWLPELPDPFGTVEMADGSDAPVYSADQVRQAMREAYEAGRAAGVPDGWKLVPAEPTEAMEIAGGRDNIACGTCGYGNGGGDPARTYREMLAAAPRPPKDAP